MPSTHLGHEYVFSTKTIVRVGVVVVDDRYRNRGVMSHVVHRGYLGLCLETGHEPTSDAGYELTAVYEGH
jgi:hypothetical protein